MGSVTSNIFSLLSQDIQSILMDSGFTSPTPIQREAIPRSLAGANLLIIAPTGHGKTEAAVLPLLHELKEAPSKGISLLYITPLRALNRDMLKRLTSWGEALGIDVKVRHGDTPQRERTKMGKKPPHMLITTPETLQIMFTGRNLRKHLSNVRWVVVDEVHELCGSERGAQLSVGLEMLVHLCGREFQRIGVSATVGSPEVVADFLGGVGREVEVIKVSMEKEFNINVVCPQPGEEDEKLSEKLLAEPQTVACIRRCRKLIEAHTSTLLFVNTRDNAEFLSARFHIWEPDLSLGIHHGSLATEVRMDAEEAFKAQRLKALVCTSSLELGIDVGHADCTLQFGSPREVTRLLQRVGRSGHRIGEVSVGTVITTTPDDASEAAVIARRALFGELEPLKVRELPMAVLANQIVSMAMMAGEMDQDTAYFIVKRAYPFRSLPRESFQEMVDFLEKERVVGTGEGGFYKKRTSINYFFENISMIPDERTYRVVDITTRKRIGILDEAFVTSYIEPFARFIVKGRSWQVVDVKDEDVLVEPSSDIGSIPAWVGEEIPVPYQVAQEVGRLRRRFSEMVDHYPLDDDGKEALKDYLGSLKQDDRWVLPTDKVITIEKGMDTIVVNACFGSKVNETLGRVLSALVASRLGASVGVQVDPYRIILTMPARFDPKEIKKNLLTMNPDGVRDLVKIVLRNSSILRWQLVHVARKMGVLKRDADTHLVGVQRLLDSFKGTVLFDETLERIIFDRMDIEQTAEVLRRIQDGEMTISVTPLSPIGRAGIEAGKEFMAPRKADRAILLALKKRLEGDMVLLVCLNCKTRRRKRVGDVDEHPVCGKCGGVLIAALHPNDVDLVDLLKRRDKALCAKDLKELRRVYANANIVLTHGKEGVMTLKGRGIGPETAGRILRRQHMDDLDLLRDILAAEINYARTRRFWD